MMTNLTHWQDDIDDALGGDFDGSLSGLCIMSLSFDFTRNGLGGGSHLSQGKENNATGSVINPSSHNPQTTSSAPANLTTTTNPCTSRFNLSTSIIGTGAGPHSMHHETNSDNSVNAFKRFKSSLVSSVNSNFNHQPQEDNADQEDQQDKTHSQNKIARQLQQIKQLVNSASTSNGIRSGLTPPGNGQSGSDPSQRSESPADHSDQSSDEDDSCEKVSTISIPDSSRHTTDIEDVDDDDDDEEEEEVDRSPAESPSSSITNQSQSTQRSPSPSDLSMHAAHENQNNLNNSTDNNRVNNNVAHSRNNPFNQNNKTSDNQQISLYSVRDGLLSGGTLKESSYTTSVITTTAPMHFKSLHHPFSLKQFPPSPYHQFSNSSLNHDFYDRYLSHDSHQPLQTPLIGIERTQDLLSLKLPPHGPDETNESHRFPRDWLFDEPNSKNDNNPQQPRSRNDGAGDYTKSSSSNQNDHTGGGGSGSRHDSLKRKDFDYEDRNGDGEASKTKSFRFSYKSNSMNGHSDDVDNASLVDRQNEPIDLNVSYAQGDCCGNSNDKNHLFNQSMKHFNLVQQGACCSSIENKHDEEKSVEDDGKGIQQQARNETTSSNENVINMTHQYHSQESMFGMDQASKQKFQYVLGAPISVATKLNEDTMTYLNQGQAYEIKLENITDVSEAKKGFMCSIINIGFHERHMQQAENELWQQWSQQHPNEKIFCVDMKLSYNVFGVESDGLNKYEFLWDSSKAAGVFIRINSISTEFTPKKHGGEKGVPFKLSIETFSYNSKTHDSYFISAACCQIKVFKPKGAERKIRSDRDKVLKRPLSEQEKYHRSCDHTLFRDCSLSSLHPMADDALCYYRHSHGHFASKQIGATSVSGTPAVQSHQGLASNESATDNHEHANNSSSKNDQQYESNNNNNDCEPRSQSNLDSESSNNGLGGGSQQGDYPNHASKNGNSSSLTPNTRALSDYSTSRLMSDHHYDRVSMGSSSNNNQTEPQHHSFGSQYAASYQHTAEQPNSLVNHNSSESLQSNALNQVYRNGLNHGSQHFNMSYYTHPIPPPPTHMSPQLTTPNGYSIAHHNTSLGYSIHQPHQTHNGASNSATSLAYRSDLITDKSPNHSTPLSHNTPFRASSLAISSQGSNLPAHFNNHSGTPCSNSSPQDFKGPTSRYQQHSQESNFDNSPIAQNHNQHQHHHHHLPQQQQQHPASNTTSSNLSHQLPCRQRSASTSSANPPNAHYSTYIGQINYNSSRHTDSYDLIDNVPQTNSWMQGNLSNSSSSCASRGCSNAENGGGSQGLNQGPTQCGSDNGQMHHYDESTENSPHKNQSANDFPISNYSRFRSGMTNTISHEQIDIKCNLESYMGSVTVNSSCAEVATWFIANRFDMFAKTFNNFSGSDLLRLSKSDLIEICGLLDGIRLFNSLHNKPIKPKRVLYICHESTEIFHPIYLYNVTLKELIREISIVAKPYTGQIDNNLLLDDKKTKKKNAFDRSGINSNSSTDSTSSIGGLSSETGVAEDDAYSGNNQTNRIGQEHHQFFNEPGLHRGRATSSFRSASIGSRTNGSGNDTSCRIDRLLIKGLTSVKIVATEQVIEMLEDESVWSLSLHSKEPGNLEACISACRSMTK